MGGHPAKRIMLTDEQRTLAEDNIRLAYWCAHQMKSVPLELEERISAALFGLVKAAGHYDPEKGILFSTYAVRIMQNEILTKIRSEEKHAGVISLNAPTGNDNHRGGALEDVVPDKRNPVTETEELLDAGSMLERMDDLFQGRKKELYLELRKNPGQNQEFYAGRMGLSQSYVSRLMKSMGRDVRRELI